VREISEDGELRGLSGSCPAIRFELKRRIVIADSRTKYRDVRCQSLRNGDDVKVKGVLLSDGTIRADEIRAEDEDDDDEGGM
jgi:hypothetical protein